MCKETSKEKPISKYKEAVKRLTKEYPYFEGIDSGKAFLFGPVDDDDDGCPWIGKGSDEDPFVLGVTTLGLLSKVNQLRGNKHFRLFHTDVTFKLSDLGYPVVSCGYTDRSRVYHLAASVIVSARTHREYEIACDSVAKVYERLFQTTLRIDVVRKQPNLKYFGA
ncbi:hypothetical protein GQ600_1451 [Phytophthora cactorum]|nr:hypothetical protein GQ600_1451 [Phytophthora cactorum]